MIKRAFILSVFINLFFGISFASENPLFVTITSKYCSTCKELDPIVEELKSKYKEKVTFIRLDVSSKDTLEEAKNIASNFGISNFYEKNKMSIPRVGLFCTMSENPEKSFLGETNKQAYEDALKVCTK